MRLRYHHLLCTSLYQGRGYSDEFNRSMTEIVQQLRENPNTQVELVAEPDVICEHCPNRTEQSTCSENKNRIKQKDEALREILCNDRTSNAYDELQKELITKLTRDNFDLCCGTCNWYQQGLCPYEKLKALFS